MEFAAPPEQRVVLTETDVLKLLDFGAANLTGSGVTGRWTSEYCRPGAPLACPRALELLFDAFPLAVRKLVDLDVPGGWQRWSTADNDSDSNP